MVQHGTIPHGTFQRSDENGQVDVDHVQITRHGFRGGSPQVAVRAKERADPTRPGGSRAV